MDEKAASAIRLNCKGSLGKTRSSLYKKGTEKQIACEEAIYSLHMKKGLDLLEHLNIFNMLNTQLSSFGVNYEDEYKALLLLASLPIPFDHLVPTLMCDKERVGD